MHPESVFTFSYDADYNTYFGLVNGAAGDLFTLTTSHSFH